MRYSIEPRYRTILKGYGVLSLAKNMVKNFGKNILGHAEKSATEALKTVSKNEIQETAEVTGYLIGNKITNEVMKFSKSLLQNDLKIFENETKNT